MPPGDAICTSCGESMGAATPRCEECKRYTHIKCTEIPTYQLVHYFNSRVAYFCKDCMRLKYDDYDETLKKIEDCMAEGGEMAEDETSLSQAARGVAEQVSSSPSAPPASQVLTQDNQQESRSLILHDNGERVGGATVTAQKESSASATLDS